MPLPSETAYPTKIMGVRSHEFRTQGGEFGVKAMHESMASLRDDETLNRHRVLALNETPGSCGSAF